MDSIRVIDLDEGPIKVLIPSWVHWMATDESGALWFFQYKPELIRNLAAWAPNKGHERFAASIRPPKDYKQELYTWR